jgi:signal transduction histidine kinase
MMRHATMRITFPWRFLVRCLTVPPVRTAAIALLIATAYYVGAWVGLVLKLPGLTPSVVWPPNAILTATLLVSDPHQWAVYLLAALPAHLAAQLPQGWPTAFVWAIFATNCSEALIAALLVRRFASGGRITFDSLRSTGTFIVCVGLAAPFFSSFLDAAVVTLLQGEAYGLVWRTRFFSNTLTELTLVSPLIMAVAPYLAWTRRLLRRRWVEAVVVCAALVGIVVLFIASGVVGGVTASPTIVLAVVLPFTTWAALRLGPPGASISVLIIEVAVIAAAMRTEGPFGGYKVIDNVLSLQIALIALTIPLMLVTALIEQQERTRVEAQQAREELAHFTRVSTIGELTASLAHELNQPLTGILANARAAQRFLAAPQPNLGEARDCLADIVADERRASDVIRRLRELLRKGKVRPVLLDINLLIGDVIKLLSSDAIMRDASITVDLEPGLPLVKADRVQMQQVILNLIVNAMEAMSGANGSARTVVVRTARDDDQTAHVAVQDTGPGLEPGTEATIFEPFYTTKAEGMGMGLSIARSIVVANGGRIWAVNNPVGGTTFHFTVPVTGDDM